jgi:PAS domain S-box-containing protein
MSHLETLLSERGQLKRQQSEMQAALEAKIAERTAELTQANQELVLEIARREQKERALRESETQYRFLFAELPQPMWIFDLRSLQFLAVNQAALRQFGMPYEEFMTLKAKDLIPANAVAAFVEDATKPCARGESRGVWPFCRKDLNVREMEITGLDLKFAGRPARLIMANEVTQTPPPQLRQSEGAHDPNSEIIARIAGGFAHHFNNILAIIDGHTSLLLRNTYDPQTTQQLSQIASAANRATTLTRQLLAAGGRQLVKPEPINLNELIQTRAQMLKRLVGERIEILTSLAPTQPFALAESRLLEHILVHLVLNSRDALAAGGTIEINTSSLQLNEAEAKRHPDAKPGEFVRLEVRDNGCGMSPEVQAHVFEPFFTTHDIGKGTGLGLASVYGEVKQLSGWIECNSQLGVGTEFSIFLPSSAKPVSRPATQTRQASASKQQGTVLLVEPDDRARGVARFILNKQGYHVIEADSARIAELLWEGQSARIDLLLSDVRPGGGSGQEFAARLRQKRPDLKVLFTATPSLPEAGDDLLLSELPQFIAKPFSPDKLLQAVQSAWPQPSESSF